MSSLTAEVRGVNVIITADGLTVDLNDGRSISVPLSWYPRLFQGTPDERNNGAFWERLRQFTGPTWMKT